MTLDSRKVEKLLQDQAIQNFIMMLAHSMPVKSLKPSPSLEGGIRYEALSGLGLSEKEVERVLKVLDENGVLEKRIYRKVLCCPACRFQGLEVKAYCPHCGSSEFERKILYEHRCGHIGFQAVEKESKVRCPGCGKVFTIEGAEVMVKGRVYECAGCRKTFDAFDVANICRRCHREFRFEEGVLENLYEYALREEALPEVLKHLSPLTPLRGTLERLGFKVSMPGSVVGVSGISYSGNIVARKPVNGAEKVVLIDGVIGVDVVDASSMLELIPKVLDVNPDAAFYVAIPRLEEKAKKLAVRAGIVVVEARTVQEALTIMERELVNLDSPTRSGR